MKVTGATILHDTYHLEQQTECRLADLKGRLLSLNGIIKLAKSSKMKREG